MLNFFLFLLGCLGVWKSGQYVSGFIEEQWLLEPQRRQLQEQFENWWISIAEMKPRTFAVALAKACSDQLASLFGKRLFSKRALKRTSAAATFLLLSSLLLTSIAGVSLNPWNEFELAVKALKEVRSRMQPTGNPEVDKTVSEGFEKLEVLAKHYGTVGWKTAYCVTFFLLLMAANAASFFLSVALSRLILQEIVLSGRVFAAVSLLSLNLFLVVSTGTLFLLVFTVLAYPALWLIVPLAYVLSKASFLFLVAIVLGAGLLVWVFGSTALKLYSLIAILPCLGTGAVCLISLLAMTDRKRFHNFCSAVILRCTGKKPLSFIVGFAGFVAVLGALISRLLHLLPH